MTFKVTITLEKLDDPDDYMGYQLIDISEFTFEAGDEAAKMFDAAYEGIEKARRESQ